jgi:hypothetical protein
MFDKIILSSVIHTTWRYWFARGDTDDVEGNIILCLSHSGCLTRFDDGRIMLDVMDEQGTTKCLMLKRMFLKEFRYVLN